MELTASPLIEPMIIVCDGGLWSLERESWVPVVQKRSVMLGSSTLPFDSRLKFA